MEINQRIEECKVNLLIAKERFRIQLLRIQAELEFLLKVQAWAATHREEGGDGDTDLVMKGGDNQ